MPGSCFRLNACLKAKLGKEQPALQLKVFENAVLLVSHLEAGPNFLAKSRKRCLEPFIIVGIRAKQKDLQEGRADVNERMVPA